MAASPQFKVHNPAGTYIAACKHIEDAAALVAMYGNGATIKMRGLGTLWHEGKEKHPAGESFDFVVTVVSKRRYDKSLAAMRRNGVSEETIARILGNEVLS